MGITLFPDGYQRRTASARVYAGDSNPYDNWPQIKGGGGAPGMPAVHWSVSHNRVGFEWADDGIEADRVRVGPAVWRLVHCGRELMSDKCFD